MIEIKQSWWDVKDDSNKECLEYVDAREICQIGLPSYYLNRYAFHVRLRHNDCLIAFTFDTLEELAFYRDIVVAAVKGVNKARWVAPNYVGRPNY